MSPYSHQKAYCHSVVWFSPRRRVHSRLDFGEDKLGCDPLLVCVHTVSILTNLGTVGDRES